jgi:hypothetical protein
VILPPSPQQQQTTANKASPQTKKSNKSPAEEKRQFSKFMIPVRQQTKAKKREKVMEATYSPRKEKVSLKPI